MANQVWKWEPTQRWVRAFNNGTKIADSKRVMLMLEGGPDQNYYFPEEDIADGVLIESDHTETSGYKGLKRFWHVETNGQRVENAAFTYVEQKDRRPDFSGYLAFDWKKIDTFMEEDEVVAHHPRSPYHRVDTIPSSRHIEIFVDEVKVADTNRPNLLFETSLPVRYYIPEDDVNFDYLEASDGSSHCPYKGDASYYDLVVNGDRFENTVWYYPDPIPEAPKLKGTLAFWPEKDKRIKILVDGEAA